MAKCSLAHVLLLLAALYATVCCSQRTVMDYLTSRGDTAVLIKCVNQSGMLQTFGNSSTNATLFLPTDKAFERLGSDRKLGLQLSKLLDDTSSLAYLLSYHIVPGQQLTRSRLGTGTFKTLAEGESIRVVRMDGRQRLQDSNRRTAKFVTSNVKAGGIVIHMIDQVMIPKGFKLAKKAAPSPPKSPAFGPANSPAPKQQDRVPPPVQNINSASGSPPPNGSVIVHPPSISVSTPPLPSPPLPSTPSPPSLPARPPSKWSLPPLPAEMPPLVPGSIAFKMFNDDDMLFCVGAAWLAGILNEWLDPNFTGTILVPNVEAFGLLLKPLGIDARTAHPYELMANQVLKFFRPYLQVVLHSHVIRSGAYSIADLIELGPDATLLTEAKSELAFYEKSPGKLAVDVQFAVANIVRSDIRVGKAILHVIDRSLAAGYSGK